MTVLIALIWGATSIVYAQDNIFDAANAATDWEIFDMPGAGGPDAEMEMDTSSVGYDYKLALHKNYKFYYAQMSGKLADDYPIEWRSDSCLKDGADHAVDLSGGFYDGGGFVKYNFPMAYTTTVLAWSTIRYYRTIVKLQEEKAIFDILRHAGEYLMKCHPEKGVFYVQVSDKTQDENYWGRIEDFKMDRKSFKIDENHKGTEPVAEAAAALAALSIIFANIESAFAKDLLMHAEELYEELVWPMAKRAQYHVSIHAARKAYKSWTGYNDELAWCNLWLYQATGKPKYRQRGIQGYKIHHMNKDISSFSWDNKNPGVHAMLAEMEKAPAYKNTLKSFCRDKMPGGEAKRTPLGMVYLNDWGALRYAASAAALCQVASDLKLDPDANHEFARSQINYILGDTGRSFIVGFGVDPPNRIYHKESFCPELPEPCTSFNGIPNRHVLEGALVGGPNDMDRYDDDPWKQQQSSVALDYNAGWTMALLGYLDKEFFPKDRPKPRKPGKPLDLDRSKYITSASDYVPAYRGGAGGGGSMGNVVNSAQGGDGVNQDYERALDRSLLFLKAQKSGQLPSGFEIPWRSTAAMGDKTPDADLTGGYFDSAGSMKYTFSIAHSMTMLIWSLTEFPNSFGDLFEEARELALYGISFLMEANPDSSSLYVVIGNQTAENEYWGRPSEYGGPRPVEQINQRRPGSDYAAEVSAALAAGSLLYTEPTMKRMLQGKASSLLQFAESTGAIGHQSVPSAGKYKSADFYDELAWANLWLYKATNKTNYLEKARAFGNDHDYLTENPKIFNIDTKVAGVQLLLALAENDDAENFEAFNQIADFCDFYDKKVPKTTRGLAYPTNTKATAPAASSSFLCGLAAVKLDKNKFESSEVESVNWRKYAKKQIDYLLGSSGRSFVVDYGVQYPTQPFHKGASCPNKPLACSIDRYKDTENANVQVLSGALVAGPDKNEVFIDDRNRPEYTEVRLDRNSYLTAALAAMIEIEEVERQLKADQEFEKENHEISFSYSLLLLLITYALL